MSDPENPIKKVASLIGMYREGFKKFQQANEELYEENGTLRKQVDDLRKGKTNYQVDMDEINKLINDCRKDFKDMIIHKKKAPSKRVSYNS